MSKRSLYLQVTIVTLLILITAFSRLIPHNMNFTPVGAIALFGGAYLGRNWKAFLIPVLVIFISDLALYQFVYADAGYSFFYDGIAWVYGSYLLIVLLGAYWIKKVNVFRVLTGSLGAAVLFFLVTNFGCWPGTTYTPDFNGLMTCYAAGVPFFKYTLAGDLIYGLVLFGTYALIQNKLSIQSATDIQSA